jgi:Fe2+ or Zn2+ uptake regulation protein
MADNVLYMADNMNDLLFKIIQEAHAPLSLSDIIKHLEQPVAERTVRRSLAKLVAENKIIRTGEKRGTRYTLVMHHKLY